MRHTAAGLRRQGASEWRDGEIGINRGAKAALLQRGRAPRIGYDLNLAIDYVTNI